MQSQEAVSSAENVVLLLVALHERGRLRVAEAAELLSVTPPTAHRLLSTLKRHQFANQDRQRAYLPGTRLRLLAQSSRPQADLSTLAHPHLVALSHDAGGTAHLMTLEGNGCRFVDGADSPRALRVGSRVGLLMAAHTTSGGRVLLAQLTDAELADLYPDRRIRMRDGTVRDLAALRRELAIVRRRGYALCVEETEQGVNAVAVPVLGTSGKAVAAVAIACPSAQCNRRRLVELVPQLQATAAGIAHSRPQ